VQCRRGLDNAGKTTIVKKFNGEEIDTIEPTLGFNIKTMDYRGSIFFESPTRIPSVIEFSSYLLVPDAAVSMHNF
jgi:GTPase SAR1 family protein